MSSVQSVDPTAAYVRADASRINILGGIPVAMSSPGCALAVLPKLGVLKVLIRDCSEGVGGLQVRLGFLVRRVFAVGVVCVPNSLAWLECLLLETVLDQPR